MRISIVDSVAGFQRLQGQWEQLFIASGTKSPFLSWDWMYEWWRCYNSQLKQQPSLYIICLYDEHDRLTAILPLFKKIHGILFGYSIAALQFLGTEIESSDYLDIICSSEFAAEALEKILASGALDYADIMEFANLTEDSLLYRHRQLFNNYLHTGSFCYHTSTCPYLCLPSSEEELIKQLSPNMRSNLKNMRNRIKKQTSLTLEIVHDPQQIAESVAALFHLHQQRFSDKEAFTKFTYEKRGAFHTQIAQRFMEKKWLQLYLIIDGPKPIGALYCYRFNKTLMYFQGGFDPEYAHLRLGQQLIFRAICDAIAEGFSIFDFMRGNEDYKYRWTQERLFLYKISWPLSHRGKFYLLYKHSIFTTKHWLKKPANGDK